MMGRHRKAIAAGSGVLLIALGEYAITTPDVELALAHVVPAGVAPLVPILFGGLATVLAVWKASNADPAASLEPPASSGQDAAAAAAVASPVAAPALEPMAEPEPSTSLVQLLPAPRFHRS